MAHSLLLEDGHQSTNLAALSFCSLRKSSCCCLSCLPRFSIWCWWSFWILCCASSDMGPFCWFSKFAIVARALNSSFSMWLDISSTRSRRTWIDAYKFSSPPCIIETKHDFSSFEVKMQWCPPMIVPNHHKKKQTVKASLRCAG